MEHFSMKRAKAQKKNLAYKLKEYVYFQPQEYAAQLQCCAILLGF